MLAGGSGMFPWQDILAGLFGGFVWRVSLAHSFAGFSQAMKRHQIALVEGGQRQERALLYCATGSPSEPWAGGAKRNLGVWAPAARCGNICSSPQVRDYQVHERIGTEYRNSKRQPHPLQEQN
jgi:hypothetical protein